MPIITKIKHPGHPEHRLKLEHSSAPYICDGCKELGFGKCYRCPRKACNFYLHKECAIPASSLHHPFFEKCDFKFYHQSPRADERVCDGCWRDVLGSVYQCSHDKPYDLHPCCAKLNPTLYGEGMKLELKANVPSKCLKCQRLGNSTEGAKGWSYVSTCGKYCFHVACVKEMVYEAWEMGYFNYQESDISGATNYNTRSLAVEELKVIPSSSAEIVQQSRGKGKASSYWKTVASVLGLIISAIFVDPFTASAALLIALVHSLSD